MTPDLNPYLERIGFEGKAKADLETLKAVHRAQVLTIPYENLDVYLERPVDQDIARIFQKIVHEGRGGWCYEMNGLLGWALKEIGFDVTRHVGGVHRDQAGDDVIGNHLFHTVELEGTRIVDAGLGDGIVEPILLEEGSVSQGVRDFKLEKLNDGFWRFHNPPGAMPGSFDFQFKVADEARLSWMCNHLQDDPQSMFRQNLVCQKMTRTGIKSLIGRTLKDTDAGLDGHVIESEEELHKVITETFAITPPSLEGLWDKVVSRHEELFGSAGS